MLASEGAMTDRWDRVSIDKADALWAWLDKSHQSETSYLLVTWKKAQQDKYVSREEVLDALLAYGWVDGRRYVLDDARTMQLICKRKQQKWTSSYRDRVAKLQAQGLMQPAGMQAVTQAKKQGTWLANEDADALICPDDLRHTLRQTNAEEWWDSAAPSYRRNLLRWVAAAKKDITRQKRCDAIAEACAQKRKIKNM